MMVMKRISLALAASVCSVFAVSAAQRLNNPIGPDGCYIVRWDCENNTWASSNSMEADETFTFAIDITATEWESWLKGEGSTGTRGIATNFSTDQGQIARNGDRLYHIQGNIYGKTINLAQLAEEGLNLNTGTSVKVYSNLFGFEYTASNPATAWWINPSDDVTGNSDCMFRTAPYTASHTGSEFYTDNFDNIYSVINQKGYAAPCVNAGSTPSTPENPENPDIPEVPDTIVTEGSQVYLFPSDKQGRGYINRPYQRYEAEPGCCTTDGTFLSATDDQRLLQSEASHQQALNLTAVGQTVSWVVDKAGDGLTIRFSLPDSENGQGTTGTLDVYAGQDKVGTLNLNSYWAWQYCDATYPDNNPHTGNVVVRMRFDETHIRLSRQVKQGETLTLQKTDGGSIPYTIDFVELEPVPTAVTYDQLDGDKVRFDGNGDVGDFIMNNQGRTIYIPEGTWNCSKRIYLRNADGTRVIGAGMWYTTIYFTAPSDNASTYSYRGFEADRSNLLIEGLYLNTVNNCRYYNNNNSKQVGKGFMGGMGRNSVIRGCWVEHFECGAWIADYSGSGSSNLLVEHCRFRNNYADGINCSHGSSGHTIRYCSFRNNGDDDMASWSTARRCSNITFAYCTAENNWRASSLGFFGGDNHTAHHLYIADALESGVRVNSDFSGAGFTNSGTIDIHDVTIDHSGCPAGNKGTTGDFWGGAQGAFNIGGTGNYPIYNVHLDSININNSRWNNIYVRAGGNKITGMEFNNIHINGGNFGIYFSNVSGCSGSYCHFNATNLKNAMFNSSVPSTWTELFDCNTGESAGESLPTVPFSMCKSLIDGQLVIILNDTAYDVLGRKL